MADHPINAADQKVYAAITELIGDKLEQLKYEIKQKLESHFPGYNLQEISSTSTAVLSIPVVDDVDELTITTSHEWVTEDEGDQE